MKENVIDRILFLKEKRHAVILAHNYQPSEIQTIADYVGDSLELSKKASLTDADTIVFCGVHFMAETAKILSPQKTVLLPVLDAGCPLADTVTVNDIKRYRELYPDGIIVTYVNSSAEVKALSDYCCTSSNAVDVVRSLPLDKPVIFIPDKFLGSYVMKMSRRQLILHEGYCSVHCLITSEDIIQMKKKHPDAIVMVHPECRPEVTEIADYVLSTSGMYRLPLQVNAKEFIVGTETGILHRLKREYADKRFYPATEKALCSNMKKIKLEDLLLCLEKNQYLIEIPEDILKRAFSAVQRMISISSSTSVK